ncbi:unnamed protein product, partial [Arabidopsis halleri]
GWSGIVLGICSISSLLWFSIIFLCLFVVLWGEFVFRSGPFSCRLQSSVGCGFVWAQSLSLRYRSDRDLYIALVSFLALTDLGFPLPRFRRFQKMCLVFFFWV